MHSWYFTIQYRSLNDFWCCISVSRSFKSTWSCTPSVMSMKAPMRVLMHFSKYLQMNLKHFPKSLPHVWLSDLTHVYKWVWQPCESINSVTISSTSETISGLFVVLYVCMCCCQSGCKYSPCVCYMHAHACTKDMHRQWAWWGLIKVAIGKRKTEWGSFHFKQILLLVHLIGWIKRKCHSYNQSYYYIYCIF